MNVGKFEASARDTFEQVRAANHQAEVPFRLLASVYAQMGDWDRANAVLESALRLFATDDRAVRAIQEQRMHWQVGLRYVDEAAAAEIRDPFNAQMVAMLRAPPADALAELQRAFEASADDNPKIRRDIALWAGHLGDPDLALAAMRKVVDARPAEMWHVWMPQLASMRGLPEFKSFMTEIGMVEYWKRNGWPPFCSPVGNDFECH